MMHPEQFHSLYETEHASARVTLSGYVSNIHVPDEHRRQGHGTALLQQIANDADRLQKPLRLHARKDLHEWYGRFGFQQVAQDTFGPRLERAPH